MTAVIVVSHFCLKDVEITTPLFLLYDLEIFEGDCLIVNIVYGEQWAGNLSQIPANTFHGMDKAHARSDEEPSIAEPIFVAILSLWIAFHHMGSNGWGEESQSSGYILFPVSNDAVPYTVVHHRGCNSHQFIRGKGTLAVGFTQLEGHHPPHADTQHVECLILIPEVFVVSAEVIEPLGECGVGKLLRICSEAGQQRCVHIQSCFMKALSAVVVYRRGGWKAMDKQDCLLVSRCSFYDAFSLITEGLGFIDGERCDILVTITKECRVPNYKHNDKDNDKE